MATSEQQTLENVERRRAQLDETVAKFKTALEHWSTWELEYEILKEELRNAGDPSSSEMVTIARGIGGTLVTEKEIEELLGKGLQTKRTANQVIDMIARRIDYVQQNRSTAEKQLERAEKQLAGFSLLSDPGLENEDGLPMMDIEEELDENENVVSSTVSQPGKVAPELVEALRKAGVDKSASKDNKKAELSNAHVPRVAGPDSSSPSAPASVLKPAPSLKPEVSATLPETQQQSPSITSKPKDKANSAPRKSVSFADNIQVQTLERPETLQDDLKNWNLQPGARVYELDDDENVVAKAVVPSDSPAEAALRREMLEYGMSEVNGVVAELELEDEDEDEFDEDYDSENESEEEDKYGRSTRRYLTEEYEQQMRDLEKKLNARMVENVGPNPERHSVAEEAKDVRTLRVRKDEEFDQTMTTFDESGEAGSPQKGVRFAEDISISDAKPVSKDINTTTIPVSTISDTIVERAPSVPQPPSATPKPGKVSRFMGSRTPGNQLPFVLPTPPIPEPPPVPTGPSRGVLATSIAEHSPHPSEPQVPSEFDPILHQREIQTEYHKMRNKMIQHEGGFAEPAEEDDEDAFVEERNGKTKKVSRFKAARLKAEGL